MACVEQNEFAASKMPARIIVSVMMLTNTSIAPCCVLCGNAPVQASTAEKGVLNPLLRRGRHGHCLWYGDELLVHAKIENISCILHWFLSKITNNETRNHAKGANYE